jgi:hypothetical protein
VVVGFYLHPWILLTLEVVDGHVPCMRLAPHSQINPDLIVSRPGMVFIGHGALRYRNELSFYYEAQEPDAR